MLDSIRKGQRWLTAFFIAVIGVVFVFFIGLGGPLTDSQTAADIVVQLDDIQLSIGDYQRVRAQQQQRLSDALGDQFDPTSTGPLLDSQALRSLVNQAVLVHSANAMGIRVSQEEIKDQLRRDPSLRDADGRFDQESFDSFVRWEYGNQQNFLEAQRRALLTQKMVALLYSQAQVADAEARLAARYNLEKIRIAFIALDAANLPEAREPSDEDLAEYLSAHEEELRAAFEEQSERFQTPEQVRLSHIFFRVPAGADEAGRAEAQARGMAALVRLVEGEEFAALAAELSDDPQSKEKGGDLGLLRRGVSDPALEEVAFGMEVGDTSELVVADAGIHILLLQEKIEASSTPFDEAGLELARQGARLARAQALAEELSQAVRDGKSVEDAARDADLTLERTALFGRRRDGYVPGLGASETLADAAFALSLDAPSSPEIFELGDRRALVQVLEREEPSAEDLASATILMKEQLEDQKRQDMLQMWIDLEREALLDSNRLIIDAAKVASS